MFERLSSGMEHAIRHLRGRNTITALNITTALKDIRRALLQADVSYKVANDLIKDIKEEALGRKVLSALSPGKMFTAIACEALTRLMGTQEAALDMSGHPNVILLAGLQGTGKTTFAVKLAAHIKKQGIVPLLVSCDVHRPAAAEQLATMGQNAGLGVYADSEEKNPLTLAKKGLAHAKAHACKALVIDTAGRLAVDDNMMQELTDIQRVVQPQETLLVVDAMTGQDAVQLAKRFHAHVAYTGIVLTKLDGDSRGGAALSVRAVVDVPVKFISYGEKVETIDKFYPDRMAKRILNMGDLTTLMERAQDAFDTQEVKRLSTKVSKNTFDLRDFLRQMQRIKKMGGLQELLSMVPGMRKMKEHVNTEESAAVLRRMEVIIASMTPKERAQPHIINTQRKRRIAGGSGRDVSEVNDLLKRYNMARKMMRKGIKKGNSDPFSLVG